MRLDFPLLANPSAVGIATAPGAFTPEECERILAAIDPASWCSSRVEGRRDGVDAKVLDLGTRSVHEQMMPIDEERWPLTRLASVVHQANDENFQFEVTGFAARDLPVVLRYEADSGDHYVVHLDVGRSHSTRKLTFVVQLSPPDSYEGGELVFPIDGRQAERQQGSMTIFPSYKAHKVDPVRRGTRHALVGWVHGPAFR